MLNHTPRAVAPGRRGVTLLEIIVALAIIVVIAGAIFLAVGSSSRTGGDAKRVDEAAVTLAKLATALAKYSNMPAAAKDQSFAQTISGTANGGVNAGRLSYLTTKILATDRDSCNTAYGPLSLGWLGPFYSTPVPTTGLKIAEGFFANELLVRYDQSGVPNIAPVDVLRTPGTLAIVIPNVALEDARALQQAVEGDQTGGVNSVVRFNANGDLPVTVSYHVNIHGC
jgi:prepilin-type N-terminal cleavage/methylation domain-containing protein